jgi:signal transduction histidine kinase
MDAATAVLATNGPAGLAHWLAQVGPEHPEAQAFHAVDAEGQVLGAVPAFEAVAEARRYLQQAPAPEQRIPLSRMVRDRDGHAWLVFVTDQPPGQRPPVVARLGPGDPHGPPDGLERHMPLLLAGLVVSSLCSAGLAAYLTRPLGVLRKGFGELAAGHLDIRIAESVGRRRDEIADLVRDFDRMAARLDSLVEAQTRLLHDVSHELRSPLARLQIAADLAAQDPARAEASLARIEREVGRLDRLVGDILDYSRLEADGGRQPAEVVDLAALLADIVADAEFEAQAQHKRVRLQAVDCPPLPGHRAIMERAIENVLRNAVKFTQADTEVSVTLSADGGDARLQVADRGPGVPPAMLMQIFEPFTRAGLQRESEGTGLGLAIVARAMLVDGGRYHAANRADGGLEVTLTWPLGPRLT